MRAFILPSLFLLILALALRIDLYFTIAWFLIGLYALSRLWARKAAQRLQVVREYPERAFNGDRVIVALTLRNESRLPVPWIEVEESVPVELREASIPSHALALGGHGRREWTYPLVCRQRGYYRLGPLRLQTGDLLGIEQRMLLLAEERRFTVYPRIVALERLGLPTRSALTTLPSRMPLFEDPSRIMGVRNYQAGDSPRRIHWPATARTGTLLVKQYQPAIARDTHLCLDLALRDYPLRQRHAATEMAIVTAASLAHHIMIREGLPAGLAILGEVPRDDGSSSAEAAARISLPPRSERAHLVQMLETLARVAVTTDGDFATMLRDESLRLSWGSTMLAIVGQVDAEMAHTLLYLKRTGHAVGVIVVQPGRVLPQERAALADIPIHHVWSDFDLEALA